MKKHSLIRNFVILFGLLLVILISILSYNSINEIVNSSRRIEYSFLTINKIDRLELLIKNLQISRRSYIITGDTTYITSYNVHKEELLRKLNELNSDFSGYSSLHRKNEISELLDSIFVNHNRSFDAYLTDKSNIDIQKSITTANTEYFNRLDTLFSKFDSFEKNEINKNNEIESDKANFTAYLIAGGCSIVLLFVYLMMFVYTKKYDKEKLITDRYLDFINEMMNNLPVVIFTLDGNGRFTFIKGKGRTNTEFDLNGFNQSTTVWDLYKNNENMTDVYQKAFSGEEVRDTIPNNSGIFYDIFLKPVKNKSGKVVRVLGVLNDVTDKIMAEIEGLDLNNELDQIMNNVPVVLFAIDKNGDFLFLKGNQLDNNPYFDKKFFGKNIWDIVRSNQKMTLAYSKAFNGNYSEFIDNPNNGSYFKTILNPVLDENNNVIKVIGITHDITDIKLSEENLFKANQHLNQLFDNLPVIVNVLDANGKFLFIGGKGLEKSPYNKEDVIGTSIWNMEAKFPHMGEICKKAYNSGTEVIDEYMSSYGRWYHSVNSPVKDLNGKVIQMNIILYDITELKESEKNVKALNDRVDFILSNIPVLIFSYDENEKLEYAKGNAIGNITNINPEQLIGKSIEEINIDNPENVDIIRKAYNGTGIDVILKTFIDRYFFTSIRPVKDENGKVINITGIAYDITDLKETQEKLFEANRYMDHILNNAPVILSALDENGIFTYVKGKSIENTEYKPEDIIGKSIWDMAANDPEGIELYKKVYSGQHVNTEYISNGKYYYSVNSPLIAENGKVTGVITLSYDVTDIRKSEINLVKTSRELEQVISNVPIALLSIDKNGIFTFVKGAALKGLNVEPEYFIGKSVWELYKDNSQVIKIISKALVGEETEGEIQGNFGRTFQVKYIPIKNSKNEIIAVNGIAYDVTEQQMINKELLKAQKSLERLNEELEDRVVFRTRQLSLLNTELDSYNHSVAHELLNPVASINMLSDSMLKRDAAELPVKLREKLSMIKESSDHVIVLIKELLNFSAYTKQDVENFNVDMNVIFNTVIKDIELKNMDTKFEVKHELPPVVGNPILLKEVVTNYLSNAVKFSRKKQSPVIEIGYINDDKEHIYYVKDNGAGFDMNYSDKLFTVFQRIHPRSEFEGSGIGLSLSKRIIHKHGGRVWAEGKPEEGAVFYFSLPKNINAVINPGIN